MMEGGEGEDGMGAKTRRWVTRMAVWQFSRLGDRVEVEFEFFEFLAGFSELINAGRSVTTGSNFSLMNHGAPSTNFRDPLVPVLFFA